MPARWLQVTTLASEDARQRASLERGRREAINWAYTDRATGVSVSAWRSGGLVQARVVWNLREAGLEKTIDLFEVFVGKAIEIAASYPQAFSEEEHDEGAQELGTTGGAFDS